MSTVDLSCVSLLVSAFWPGRDCKWELVFNCLTWLNKSKIIIVILLPNYIILNGETLQSTKWSWFSSGPYWYNINLIKNFAKSLQNIFGSSFRSLSVRETECILQSWTDGGIYCWIPVDDLLTCERVKKTYTSHRVKLIFMKWEELLVLCWRDYRQGWTEVAAPSEMTKRGEVCKACSRSSFFP